MTEKPRILVVDDEPRNVDLIEAILGAMRCEIVKAYDGEEAIQKVQKGPIDLIISDVMMPKMDGFEMARRLREDPDTRLIPIIMVTALGSLEDRIRGIEAGADDFLTKPVRRVELLARATALLQVKRFLDRLENRENVVLALARTVEARDNYTEEHTDRTGKRSVELGQRMGLSDRELEALAIGAAVHDIGKIGIPDDILRKAGPLTEREFLTVKNHPVTGHQICGCLRTFTASLGIVRWHHERLDGSGYPDGLKGRDIPNTAMITHVVDVYDALTSDRSYRKAMTHEEAVKILREEVDKRWLDRDCVEQLIALLLE